ncbi:hypothetical protein F4677DRAFT_442576 [Hypoxylon crocopeplum]|nr:hypothetical protein F4677DRAFT_442576 [Hypoxylon crocopeplum]
MPSLRGQSVTSQDPKQIAVNCCERDFPEWKAKKDALAAKVAAAKAANDPDVEFLLASNWVLRPEGIRQFLADLEKHVKQPDVYATYDFDTHSVKIKCMASDEGAVMAACQSVMDGLVRGELAIDLAQSKKIARSQKWHTDLANEHTGEESILALCPSNIQGHACRAVWIMPEELAKRDVTMIHLLHGTALAKLQQVTDCAMETTNEGLVMYIGAESRDKVAKAKQRLNALAKYVQEEPDNRCESFVYAEKDQGSLATFKYLDDGPRSGLTTFYLDRAKYNLDAGTSAYGKLFEQGVVVSLSKGNSQQPIDDPRDIIPAISCKEKNKPYVAFPPNRPYEQKRDSCDLEPDGEQSSPFTAIRRARVASWVAQLPQQESTLPDGEQSVGSSCGLVDSSNPRQQDNNTGTLQSSSKGTQNGLQMPLNGQRWNSGQGQDSGKSTDRYDPLWPSRNVRSHLYRPNDHRYGTGRFNPNLGGEESRVASRIPSTPQQTNPSSQIGQLHSPVDFDNGESRPPSYVSPQPRHQLPFTERTEMTELNDDTLKESVVNQQRLDEVQAGLTEMDVGVVTPESGEEGTPEGSQVTSTEPATAGVDPFVIIWDSLKKMDDKPPAQRSTMRQQASSTSHQQVREGPAPALLQAMNQKLVQMMGSLELFTGRISLKAELGRLCLTKVNHAHVRAPPKSLHDMKEALDKQYVNPRDVMFTNILTAEGADANYISFMRDGSGRIWEGDMRRTVYEVTCCANPKEGNAFRFTVKIDGRDFTHEVNQYPADSCSIFVHCPKRRWDFQVTLAQSQDLEEICGNFVNDLVESMRVKSQGSGIPLLEFLVNKAYKIEILLVRTLNIGTYKCSEKSVFGRTRLEITEVHDMKPTVNETEDWKAITFKQRRENQQLGQLATWYEASLQSCIVNEALKQNEELEFAEEVQWSPNQLREAGAFNDLIRSATEMVKRIDGVGYWGDNFQDTMIHGRPPSGSSAAAAPRRFFFPLERCIGISPRLGIKGLERIIS